MQRTSPRHLVVRRGRRRVALLLEGLTDVQLAVERQDIEEDVDADVAYAVQPISDVMWGASLCGPLRRW